MWGAVGLSLVIPGTHTDGVSQFRSNISQKQFQFLNLKTSYFLHKSKLLLTGTSSFLTCHVVGILDPSQFRKQKASEFPVLACILQQVCAGAVFIMFKIEAKTSLIKRLANYQRNYCSLSFIRTPMQRAYKGLASHSLIWKMKSLFN